MLVGKTSTPPPLPVWDWHGWWEKCI